jgi:DNA-binding NarL/FixJ family response regulator
MATKPVEELKAVIFDAITGLTTERELTADEIADREAMIAESLARKTEQEAKAAARESALAKLAELGLTAEEIAAL